MDSSWLKVYVDGTLLDRKLLRFGGGLPYALNEVQPPEISAQAVHTTPSNESPYDILWSPGGDRIACACRGWLVAACDLTTGETIDDSIGNMEDALRVHQKINDFLEK